MHNKGGAPVAFVEYADVRCAAQALVSLQGTYLLSSDRGGVRIEYARNKMAETGATGGPTSSPTSSSSPSSLLASDQQPQQQSKLEMDAKMTAVAAAAANSALSQAVQGAPLHALGLYGHHIWLGECRALLLRSSLLFLVLPPYGELRKRVGLGLGAGEMSREPRARKDARVNCHLM